LCVGFRRQFLPWQLDTTCYTTSAFVSPWYSARAVALAASLSLFDVALHLLKRHSGIVWGPGRFAGPERRYTHQTRAPVGRAAGKLTAGRSWRPPLFAPLSSSSSEEEERGLIKDLKRYARLAVAWDRHGSLINVSQLSVKWVHCRNVGRGPPQQQQQQQQYEEENLIKDLKRQANSLSRGTVQASPRTGRDAPTPREVLRGGVDYTVLSGSRVSSDLFGEEEEEVFDNCENDLRRHMRLPVGWYRHGTAEDDEEDEERTLLE
jgi:hypothetical protein